MSAIDVTLYIDYLTPKPYEDSILVETGTNPNLFDYN